VFSKVLLLVHDAITQRIYGGLARSLSKRVRGGPHLALLVQPADAYHRYGTVHQFQPTARGLVVWVQRDSFGVESDY
jgi:hypothetical protein